MKSFALVGVACILSVASLFAQDAENNVPVKKSPQPDIRSEAPIDSEDLVQLQADLQRLKILVNQMRNNLAFVQTSQTPLKHQFELEADAWQVLIDQMDRRVKKLEERKSPQTTH